MLIFILIFSEILNALSFIKSATRVYFVNHYLHVFVPGHTEIVVKR